MKNTGLWNLTAAFQRSKIKELSSAAAVVSAVIMLHLSPWTSECSVSKLFEAPQHYTAITWRSVYHFLELESRGL